MRPGRELPRRLKADTTPRPTNATGQQPQLQTRLAGPELTLGPQLSHSARTQVMAE